VQQKERAIVRITKLLETTRPGGISLAKTVLRPEIGWDDLGRRLPELQTVEPEVARQVLFDAKYAGYIARQEMEIARQHRLAEKRIPPNFDYSGMSQLRAEACEKLTRIGPTNLAQASRISGITPADIALLMIHL